MKDKKIFYFIFVIGIILFNLCAFVIPSKLTLAFWIAYIFSMIGFIMQPLIFNNDNIKENVMKKSFFGYSFIYIDTIYVILQLILFSLVKFIPEFPVWLAIIMNGMLLGIFIITLCSTSLSIDYINSIEDKTKEKVNFIKSIQIDIELLIEQEDNAEIKDNLLKLVEKVRYSDPMSNEKLIGLENKITKKVEDLKESKEKNTIIKELGLLFEERNKKCKLYK